MLHLATPPPSVLPGFADPADPLADQGLDAALMALSLFTVWAVRTGRTLRPVPVTELSVCEIEAFWDDHIGPAAPATRPSADEALPVCLPLLHALSAPLRPGRTGETR